MIVLTLADKCFAALGICQIRQSLPVDDSLSESFVPASCLIELCLDLIREDRCSVLVSLDLLDDLGREVFEFCRILGNVVALFDMKQRETSRILLDIITYVCACKDGPAYVELEAYKLRICLGEQQVVDPLPTGIHPHGCEWSVSFPDP